MSLRGQLIAVAHMGSNGHEQCSKILQNKRTDTRTCAWLQLFRNLLVNCSSLIQLRALI